MSRQGRRRYKKSSATGERPLGRGGALALSPADLERIAALDRNYRFIVTDFWVLPGSPWTLQTIWDGP